MRISDWSSDVCSSDLEASTLFDRGTQDDDRRWNPILTAAPSFSGKTPDFEFGNVGSNPTGASIRSQRLRSYRHELPRKGHLHIYIDWKSSCQNFFSPSPRIIFTTRSDTG